MKLKKTITQIFFLDNNKFSLVSKAKVNKDIQEYLKKLFNSDKFIRIINEIYDKNIYNWIKKQCRKSNVFNMRPLNGLVAIAIVEELLLLKKNYMKKLKTKMNSHKKNSIINDIMKQI